MGQSCTPRLHLDLTGRAQVPFKVTTDSTFDLFSKAYSMTHWAAKFAYFIMRIFFSFPFIFLQPVFFH